ncbi:hypothetical protein A2U01_0095602, partial [Trifolium medium]|nr:hypothetical protein [Trifolium medium]
TWEGAARRLIRAGLSASCSEQNYLLAIPSRNAGSHMPSKRFSSL